MPTDTQQSGSDVDSWRFMFAAGFTFGVALTLLVLAVAVPAIGSGAVTPGEVFASSAAVNLLAVAVFALVIGVALYLLAFPANREWLESAIGGDDDAVEGEAEGD